MSTILVVDDEPLIRDVVVDVLRDEGYTVVTANDGRAALEVVQQAMPDLVLMDVMMPRMDGPTAFHAMRAHPHGADLPVILMSAMAEPSHLDPGITAFMHKPIDLERLLALLVRLLSDGR